MKRSQLARVWIIAVLLVIGGSVSAAGLPALPDEYRVKAAFLYNFAKFVQWPPAPDTGPLIIGIAGDDPFGALLDQAVKDKTAAGHELVVRRLQPSDDVTKCHILFIASADPLVVSDLLRRAARAAVLTVGETPEFIQSGGIIRFVIEGDRVRFQINVKTAARSGLNVSSQLLRVAAQ